LDIETIKRHWLVSLAVACAGIVAATWGAAVQVLVAQRDFEIARLQKQIDELKASPLAAERAEKSGTTVLPETGVFEHNSATTIDGACSIQIVEVSPYWGVTISVTAGSEQPPEFKGLQPGSRITVQARGATYFVDIHRVRDAIVDLAVYRQAN
jgi:hypothetical protein